MQAAFRRFSERTSAMVGSSWAFVLAAIIILGWALSGPLFGFSNTWQLVINTGTTIVTFLMVFLIQNTQNRDSKAIHLKLDELLKGVKGARTNLVDLEDMSDEDLNSLQKEFEDMRHQLGEELRERSAETGTLAGATAGATAGAAAGHEVAEHVAQKTAAREAHNVAEDTVRETVPRK